MGKAARAIILKDDKILIMHRNKRGKEYFTLVGGRVNNSETTEEALAREVKEETGLVITSARLVFVEKHPEPYNEQYVFLCEADRYDSVALQETSEEALMNKLDSNSHKPIWIETESFSALPFLTGQLQTAIDQALKSSFPSEPIAL
jgi:ADP-ribose pyrophosphatase YjhB (NUDIX family)